MYQPPEPTSYFEQVWEIVRQCPGGYVTTYGQIASMIPPPENVNPPQYDQLAARWVGTAMNRCPDDVPWQRVINAQGRISLPRGSKTATRQRTLLTQEGVEFDDSDRVDFNRFGWDGPSSEWLKQHNYLPPRSLKTEGGAQLNLF